MATRTDEQMISELAERYSISPGGVRAVLDALRSGGGSMAQFSHADFGGMSQWSTGMTMVGDMFNHDLKSKLNSIATDLAGYLRDQPKGSGDVSNDVSYQSQPSRSSNWWPEGMGHPSSVGAQNNIRYAIFPDSRRLVLEDHGRLRIYDTGDHKIFGVGQAQGSATTISLTSQSGLVKVADLTQVR